MFPVNPRAAFVGDESFYECFFVYSQLSMKKMHLQVLPFIFALDIIILVSAITYQRPLWGAVWGPPLP